MKKVFVILLMVTTLLVFNGCQEKIMYIHGECPQLQTWKVAKPTDINFTVETRG